MWKQATLPIKSGGLGIRSVVDLSASAFLASIHGADTLATHMLGRISPLVRDTSVSRATTFWSRLTGTQQLSVPSSPTHLQKSWDDPVVSEVYQALVNGAANDGNRARLLAAATPHAGDWLKAIPASSLGLRLDNDSVRISAGLRLGASICSTFTCICGKMVDTQGGHVLSCTRSAGPGRQSRHSLINDLVLRAFTRAGIPATKEPSGLVPGTALRPDGATIIPWTQGRCLAWDVTCPDTLSVSSLAGSSGTAGFAAEQAARNKERKYQQLMSSHTFIPIALETMVGRSMQQA